MSAPIFERNKLHPGFLSSVKITLIRNTSFFPWLDSLDSKKKTTLALPKLEIT